MNLRLAKPSLVVTALIYLNNCVGVSRVSGPPFDEVIGRTLTTQRPTFLAPQKVTDSTSEAMFSGGHDALFLVDPSAPPSTKTKTALIPAGQPIKILEVRKDVGDGYITYIAVGDIFVPAKRQFVRFYYDWGFNREVYRAPWESDRVPQIRKR